MDKVRIGIVGLGNMGALHAGWIQKGEVPGLELTAVCDVVEEKVKKYEGVKHFYEAGEMIRSGEIDAILIATPHYSHTTIGIDALGHGLHVLVEKPISVHKRDCERLIAAYEQRPKKSQLFAAMFNQRTDPHYTKLRELITSGELGAIRRVIWNITFWFRSERYYASGDWRATWAGEGGGVLLNQCPHQLDLWQWLFGMPKRVRAFCEIGRYHNIEVEDDVTAYMEYEDGCKGVFITTTGETPGANRLEITTERGLLIVDHAQQNKILWKRLQEPMSEICQNTPTAFPKVEVWDVTIPVEGHGKQHVGVLQNFANAILKGEELLAPAVEGIHSVELANAMLYSSFINDTVEMPLDSSAYEAKLKELIAGSNFGKKKVEASESTDMSKSFS